NSDDPLEALSRIARESPDDRVAMWAADSLAKYFQRIYDYNAEASMLKTLLERKKKFTSRPGGRKYYAGRAIRLAYLHLHFRKDHDAAREVCREILADTAGLEDWQIKQAKSILGAMKWQNYIQQAPVGLSNPVETPSLPCRAFVKEKRIFFAETAGSEPREIFFDRNMHPHNLGISPSGNFIAATGTYEDSTSEVFLKYKCMPSVLKLLDTRGEVLKTITRVNSFAWSPKEDRIVFLELDYPRACDYSTSGKAVWIADPRSGETRNITESFLYRLSEDITWTGIKEKFGVYDLSWPAFDCNIYVFLAVELEHCWGQGIFMYDPSTGRASPTPYEALRFSPDGRYYFDSSQEGGPSRLFFRETNQEIDIEYTGDDPSFYLQEWLIEGDKTYAFLQDGYIRLWTLDCETGTLFRRPPPGDAYRINREEKSSPRAYAAAFCTSHDLYFSSGTESRLEKIYSDEGLFILEAKMSPSGRMIALLCNDLEIASYTRGRHRYFPKVMVVVKYTGEVLKRIDGARSFAWSPDGGSLVYCDEIRVSKNRIIGESIRVLNPVSGEEKRISPEDSTHYYGKVNWTSFDGNIYAFAFQRKGHGRNPVKMKFDQSNGTVTRLGLSEGVPSEYRFRIPSTLNFSPDGRYFLRECNYSGNALLGYRENSKLIDIKLPEKAAFRNLFFLAWEMREGKAAAYVYNVTDSDVCLWTLDCESGTMSPVPGPAGAVWPLGVVEGRVVWLRKTTAGHYEVFTG
ncbi:MAG: hypothetical protein U9N45_01770, partial [Gemmatimonadota bacterium]|nr:hypothetical protein [Gemmatimonadota bacterium]